MTDTFIITARTAAGFTAMRQIFKTKRCDWTKRLHSEESAFGGNGLGGGKITFLIVFNRFFFFGQKKSAGLVLKRRALRCSNRRSYALVKAPSLVRVVCKEEGDGVSFTAEWVNTACTCSFAFCCGSSMTLETNQEKNIYFFLNIALGVSWATWERKSIPSRLLATVLWNIKLH